MQAVSPTPAQTTQEVAMVERNELSKEQISHVAYALYLQRGSSHGNDVQDWLRAEKELSSAGVAGPVKTKAAFVGHA